MPGYRPQSSDTSVHVDRLVFERLRVMTPQERLSMAAAASRAVSRLSVAGLKLRYPEESDRDLHLRAGMLRIGRELAIRLYGEAAERWFD